MSVLRVVGASIGSRSFRVDVRLDFVPRDLWVGLFVGKSYVEMGYVCRPYYVCIVPTLPIVITTERLSE